MARAQVNRLISGEVSLITLGPLTNIALAFKMDPNLPSMLKEIFMMGGNHTAG